MKFFDTLRSRLVLLVVAAIVPLFGLSIVKAVLSTDAAIARATGNLQSAASLVAANQQQVADAAYQILLAISNAPELVEGNTADCPRYVRVLKKQLPVYANLGIIGLDGYFRCHSMDNRVIPYTGDRAFFRESLAGRRFVAGGYFMGRALGRPVLPFAMPVINSAGTVAAVAFVSIDLDEMAKRVAANPLPTGSRVVITDREGLVLTVSPSNPAWVGQPLPNPMLRDMVNTMRAGIAEGLDTDSRPRIYAFRPTGLAADSPFFVMVSADRDTVLAPVWKVFRLELLVLVLVAWLGGCIAWVIGGPMIVRPTSEILKATRQMEEGRFDVRVPMENLGAGNELTRVADGINRMAEALGAREAELERELGKSRRAQRKLVDAQRMGRIGHSELNLTTQQIVWSDEVSELFGLERGTFDGRAETVGELVHPDDRARYKHSRDKAVRDGSELDIEYRIITPAGELRWIHQMGRQELDEAGVPISRIGVMQEITARKQSELALLKMTDLLRRSSEIAMIGGWELTIDGMGLVWSEQVRRIHEIDELSKLTLARAIGFYVPGDQPAISAAVQAGMDHGTPWDMELQLVTTTGRPFWARSQGQAVVEDGKVVRLVGTMQDITERRHSQAHLRLLETSISRLNDMVLITEAEPLDEPGPRIVFVNDAFERRTGYSRAEVLGKSPRFLQGPNTERAQLDRISAAMKKWEPVRSELINYKKCGEEFWIELDMVPIADANGWYTHWVAVERDITRRKQSEQAMLESEQRYAALFEAAPVPMWVIDDDHHQFMAVNDATIREYGYSRDEFPGMSTFDLHPSADFARLRTQLSDSVMLRKASWCHRRKDGQVFPVDVVSKSIRYAGKSARFVVALDLTAQREAESTVQEHLFTLQRAADAAAAITWHQTLDAMMQEFADQARGVIGAEQAFVSLSDGEGELTFTLALSVSESHAPAWNLQKLSDFASLFKPVLASNRPTRFSSSDIQSLRAQQNSEGAAGGVVEVAALGAEKLPPMRGCLAVPLLGRDGKNIGLLQLSDKYEGEFTQQDEYVAMEMARLATVGMENVQLIEEVNQLNSQLEQKVAERTEALTRQEALFRALAQQAPQVVWTANSKGQVTYLNQAWFALMGGALDDWSGTQWFSAVHPEDLPAVRANWKVATRSGTPFSGARRILAQDGSQHTMSYRASPVLDDQGEVTFWVGIDADITEIKKIEAELRLSNQELEAFSYSVSHDLRSPLNTIDGFSRLLAKQINAESGVKAMHYLSRIHAGVAQMGQLIEDILSLAQVSRVQLRHELIDLSAMAAKSVEALRVRDADREVSVSIEGNLLAYGDSRLVNVIMENLLGNAWKFSSHRAGAAIFVGQTVDPAGHVSFFVRDNGAGFDMAYADKLFRAFQRLHTAAEFPGTGIGLATVNRIIARHGGRLWAESAPDAGATFFFTLPKFPGPV